MKKIIRTKTGPLEALTTGLDVLAGLSMINPPDHPLMAMERNKLHEGQLEIVKNKDLIKDSQLVELELLDYELRLFSDKDHIDVVSLYASLKESVDERVGQALGGDLRGVTWYSSLKLSTPLLGKPFGNSLKMEL